MDTIEQHTLDTNAGKQLHINIDYNFDHQMSLSKSKCWYSNNCLHFIMCALPLHTQHNICAIQIADFDIIMLSVVMLSVMAPEGRASTVQLPRQVLSKKNLAIFFFSSSSKSL